MRQLSSQVMLKLNLINRRVHPIHQLLIIVMVAPRRKVAVLAPGVMVTREDIIVV
jgi:hypothetical protein